MKRLIFPLGPNVKFVKNRITLNLKIVNKIIFRIESEIWSFGVSMIEMATGNHPFIRKTEVLLHQIWYSFKNYSLLGKTYNLGCVWESSSNITTNYIWNISTAQWDKEHSWSPLWRNRYQLVRFQNIIFAVFIFTVRFRLVCKEMRRVDGRSTNLVKATTWSQLGQLILLVYGN